MDSATIRSVPGLLRAGHRPLVLLTVAMAILVVVSLGGLLIDPRVLGGQPIWAKPFKFAVSLTLYGATLAWMISLLTGERVRRLARRAGLVAALASGIEMAFIVLQVIRGEASHFNQATDLDTGLWRTMGGVVTVLWAATAVIAVALLREHGLARDTAWAVRLGLGVALLGMALAFIMVVPSAAQIATPGMPVSGSHSVGSPDGGPGLPLLGWSTTAGDLRIGHFVGLHALQGLPLIALALSRLAARVPALRDVRTRARLVGVAAAAWAALALLLTWQALRAQPIIAPDATTLAVAAALVVAAVVAAVVVVTRTGPRRPAPAPTPEVTA